MNKTALNEEHKKLNAKMVPFAGWEMPVEYSGLRKEHNAVRETCGLFDVSHMGEFRFRGPKALESLQWLTTNDVAALHKGQAHYTLFGNANGGLVDDLIIYCLEEGEDYLLCVNAANIDKDWRHVLANNQGALVENESSKWSQVALQGPNSMAVLEKALDFAASQYKPFNVIKLDWQDTELIVAFTGYTGERGVEIFVENDKAVALWQALLENGEEHGIEPCGLGCRDTLRTEMGYSLYGHEITDETNPYSARLGWVVKPHAKDFLGKDKMLQQKEAGFDHKLIGFKMTGRGIARAEYKLLDPSGDEIGWVTSGTPSPSLNENIGLGFVKPEFSEIGAKISVDIRGRAVEAQVTKIPFLDRTS